MTRLILIGLLVVILWLAVKNFSLQLKAALSAGSPSRPHRSVPPRVAETLVPCARCGTYIAASRALQGNGAGEAEVFCSEECRALTL